MSNFSILKISHLNAKLISRFEQKPTVTVFDTAVATRNLGDEIIMDSVIEELRKLYPVDFFYRVATHDVLSLTTLLRVRQGKISFVGGTNCLSPTLLRRATWRLRFRDTFFLNDLVLMAAGWKGYQDRKSYIAKYACNRVLSDRFIHSVRDEYTKSKLSQLGIKNVLNTGCVTMWNLTHEHTRSIHCKKGQFVITTLNSSANSHEDVTLAKILCDSYEAVFVWPQGVDDLAYAKKIYGDRATILPQSLYAYDFILDQLRGNLDYVGCRLHGGIRAIQKCARSLILSIDNRAAEISRDTGLNVISRTDISAIKSFIEEDVQMSIRIPLEAICKWREQFLNDVELS